MIDEAFVVNHGTLILTPGKQPDNKTITLNLGGTYTKLRKIEVRRVSELIASQTFNCSDWFSIGSGDSQLLVNKSQVENALQSIEEPYKKSKASSIFFSCLGSEAHIESVLTPSEDQEIYAPSSSFDKLLTPTPEKNSRLFRGISQSITVLPPDTQANREEIIAALKQQAYKITCVMTPEGNLKVVAVKRINEGTFKRIKIIRSIWEKTSAHGEFGPIAILATSNTGIEPDELTKEVKISQQLISAGVPNILSIRIVPRSNPRKTGLMMEFCSGGNMHEYSKSHFDPATGALKPEFRQEHLRLLCQVADALCGMELTQTVHCDIKASNILVKLTEKGAEARVSDFGLAKSTREWTKHIPGTYVPPEILEDLRSQYTAMAQQYSSQLRERLAYCKRLGWNAKELQTAQNKLIESVMAGVPVASKIDAWGFGILLYETMHQRQDMAEHLSWNNSAEEIKSWRDFILATLNQNDPVDQIIAKLLAKTNRINLQQARELLLQAT